MAKKFEKKWKVVWSTVTGKNVYTHKETYNDKATGESRESIEILDIDKFLENPQEFEPIRGIDKIEIPGTWSEENGKKHFEYSADGKEVLTSVRSLVPYYDEVPETEEDTTPLAE